ncbi:MAG: glycine--tRNA ligase [Patescibacteria group bacterium]
MDLMEKIVSLCKRRGFVFQSSEIYGGFGSCYDFGPQGVELKNNIKKLWWKNIVQDREDVVGLDSAILMSSRVWQASGHLSTGFADEMVECQSCHSRFRKDQLKIFNFQFPISNQIPNSKFQKSKCLECGGKLSAPRKFNLMMKTFVGPVEDSANVAYLRAETCQGIYVNFQNVLQSQRMKIPFGIGQQGKAFRNEITPGNFIFRTREFEQMEMQYFIKSKVKSQKSKVILKNDQELGIEGQNLNAINKDEWSNKEWFVYWANERMNWYLNLGIKKENLRFYKHKKDELAHYAKQGVDIEYKFPFGWQEVEGIHDRGDWDLSNHTKHSGRDLSYFDEKEKKKFIPNIIETSAGADRASLVFLLDAYCEEKVKGEARVVLKINKKLAPVKVAILPLARNQKKIIDLARKISNDLNKNFTCLYDDSGSIGRLYRRQDEVGTPYCLTVDFDSLEDKKVTVRDRDTMAQERIEISKLKEILIMKLNF